MTCLGGTVNGTIKFMCLFDAYKVFLNSSSKLCKKAAHYYNMRNQVPDKELIYTVE